MKILLTGGSGFIGRNLVGYLGARHEVLAPARTELELLDEDAVRRYFTANRIDAVVHAAVRPGHRNAKDPSGQLAINTRMFFNLVRNKDRFKKMVVLSSGLVYDMRHYLPRMKEGYFDAHVPADEGGFSKYLIAKYSERTEYITELRAFGVFGAYEDYAIRFISNAICKALFGLPITIRQDRLFDYIFIDDLMSVIGHFLEDGSGVGAYNVCAGRPVALKALAEKVREISGKDLPIVIARPGMGVEYSGDNSRLKKEMPGFECAPLDASLQKLYSWYAANKGSIDRESLLVDK